MNNNKRVLLIVEDDDALNIQYQLYCMLAYSTAPALDTGNAYEIRTASSFQEACAALNDPSVDFVSVDLSLEGDLHGSGATEPGGMRLLRAIRDLENPPAVVVVSGETRLSFARDALQNYGVLAYFQKDQPGFEEDYPRTIQAALMFMEGRRLLDALETRLSSPPALEMAGRRWQEALEQARQAHLSERNFPQDLGARIASLKSRFYPHTALPGEAWTQAVLRKRIFPPDADHTWLLVQGYIQNYAKFAAGQAFEVAPLLTDVAGLLREAGGRFGSREIFIGVWGPGPVIGPSVLALLEIDCLPHAWEIKQFVLGEFAKNAARFADDRQINPDRGPIPALAIRCWNSLKQPFDDWPMLVNQLSQPAD